MIHSAKGKRDQVSKMLLSEKCWTIPSSALKSLEKNTNSSVPRDGYLDWLLAVRNPI